MSACHNCETLAINSILTHEEGCPYYWQTQPIKCFDCGCEFHREAKYDKICPDCEPARLATIEES